MKTYLLFFLLSSQPLTLIYNTPTNQFYIVEPNSMNILVIEENIYSNISCIQENQYLLKEINFTKNHTCLINTLNKQFDLNIQDYVDLKDLYTKQDIKDLKKMNLTNIYQLLTNINHSFSLSDLYKIYNQAKKNEFQNEIHYLTYIKINDIYYPL